MIRQISVLVENEVGTLSEVTDVLAKENINIKAFSVFDTQYFGILRLIVDRPDDAERTLKENGFGYKVGNVVAIELENVPGALNGVLKLLAAEGFFVNYMYSMVLNGEEAPLMVIHLNDEEKAEQFLKEKGVVVV
ncbi:ACT domain-containing protein [Microaceticoccus formicicus]|uniref:ACT domain-containing protein n=1 Tax=Microaceticoccus formicicus TaxID=3118105 RepID=UPI003CD00A0D|nr:ACT domain-containing protein [Peptoniphilaceae bacterium AMB_02]